MQLQRNFRVFILRMVLWFLAPCKHDRINQYNEPHFDLAVWPYLVLVSIIKWLVVWNMKFMTFHILGIVTPTDFHIFQRGRYTTNQIKCLSLPSDVWLFGTRSLPGNVIDYVFKWAAGRGSERGRHVKSRLTRLAFNNTFVCTKGISWIMIQTYPNSDKSVGCLFATFMECREK